MLFEVICHEFKQKRIEFHAGLNTVLGDNEGSNYIGKSTFLELTQLPILVHVSIVLKQIEDIAIQEILKLYVKSDKQVIISLDKVNSYTNESAEILNKSAVVHLAPGGQELFGRSWSKISKYVFHIKIIIAGFQHRNLDISNNGTLTKFQRYKHKLSNLVWGE